MVAPTRCSEMSLAEQNDPSGSASSFTSFLLVPEPGPWGKTVADDSVAARFDAATADWISTNPNGLRPFAIRPVSNRREPLDRPYVAGRVGAADGLLTFDLPPSPAALQAVAGLGPLPGTGRRRPLVGVCTNGKRDQCCAIFGRRIAATLTAGYGDDLVTEISHLGGHRFAGTLMLLPWGYSYGFLNPAIAGAIVDDLLDGLVHPHHLRGRADLSPAAQAADITWRHALGAAPPDAVLVTTEQTDGEVTEVTATVDGRSETLRMRYVVGPTVAETACGGKPFATGRWISS